MKGNHKKRKKIKKQNRKQVIEKSRRGEDIFENDLVDFVHYEKMEVCSVCGGVYGKWWYEQEIVKIWPDKEIKIRRQLCRCRKKKNSKDWDDFDFNEVVTLCYCCGQELLTSGNKFSVWFCDECKEMIVKFNTRLQQMIIPIGRHSIMSGYELKGPDTKSDEKIEEFTRNWNSLVGSMNVLDDWRRERVKNFIRFMRFKGDINLVEYLDDVEGYDKVYSFLMLLDLFTPNEYVSEKSGEFEGGGESSSPEAENVIYRPRGSGVEVHYFSLIIKVDSLEEKYPGGLKSFLKDMESEWAQDWNCDGELIATLELASDEFVDLVFFLIEKGLQKNAQPVDFYVVSQGLRVVEELWEPRFFTADDGLLEFAKEEGGDKVVARLRQRSSDNQKTEKYEKPMIFFKIWFAPKGLIDEIE